VELPVGTYALSPANTLLRLHTAREGMAAKVGHDLTLGFDRWSGSIVKDTEARESARIEATIETGSLTIVEASGGVAPLTPDDRNDILKTARRILFADRQPTASFRSTSVTPDGDHGTVEGVLTLAGGTVTVTLDVTATDTGWHAETTVRQTDLGITPYKAFFGALRLADQVRIEVDANAPVS